MISYNRNRTKCFVLAIAASIGFATTANAFVLSLDFGTAGSPVETGFDKFALADGTTQTFGAITVSVATYGDGQQGSAGAPEFFADRDRGNPPDNGSFTPGDLLRDWIFVDETERPPTLGEGIDITISGLTNNTSYDFVLWAEDGTNEDSFTDIIADWSANDTLVLDNIQIRGPYPTDNLAGNPFRHTFSATSDGSGEILLRGVDAPGSIGRSTHLISGLRIIPEPTTLVLTFLGFVGLMSTTGRRHYR